MKRLTLFIFLVFPLMVLAADPGKVAVMSTKGGELLTPKQFFSTNILVGSNITILANPTTGKITLSGLTDTNVVNALISAGGMVSSNGLSYSFSADNFTVTDLTNITLKAGSIRSNHFDASTWQMVTNTGTIAGTLTNGYLLHVNLAQSLASPRLLMTNAVANGSDNYEFILINDTAVGPILDSSLPVIRITNTLLNLDVFRLMANGETFVGGKRLVTEDRSVTNGQGLVEFGTGLFNQDVQVNGELNVAGTYSGDGSGLSGVAKLNIGNVYAASNYFVNMGSSNMTVKGTLTAGTNAGFVVGADGIARGEGVGLTNLQVVGAIFTNSSVNTFATKRTTVDRSYLTNGLNIGALGDSMPWRFFRYIDPYLAEKYGANGFAMGAPSVENMMTGICYAESTAGQVIVNRGNATNTTYSTMSFAELEADEYVTWTNRLDPHGWVADTVAVYYRKESGAGTFAVQVSTNGSAFATVATVSSANATVGGGATNIALPLAKYQLRILGVSGVARVLDVGAWNSQSTGVRSTWIASGGINIIGILAHSNLYQNVWSKLDLDMLFLQMKEVHGDITTNQMVANWPKFEGLLRSSFPKADIVLVGSTPQLNSDPLLQWQDMYLRGRALSNDWAYIDLRNPLVSQQVQTNYGMSDTLGVHPNEAGGSFIASIMIRELGLDLLPNQTRQKDVYLWPSSTIMAVSGGAGNTNRPVFEQFQSHSQWDIANSGYWVSALPFTNTFTSATQTRYTWMIDRKDVAGKNWRIEPMFATTNTDSITFLSGVYALRNGKSEYKESTNWLNVASGTNMTFGAGFMQTTNNPADVQAYQVSVGGYNGFWTHTNRVLLLGVRVVNW
jgi:hypothetical protein